LNNVHKKIKIQKFPFKFVDKHLADKPPSDKQLANKHLADKQPADKLLANKHVADKQLAN
jgi:hypothetical protein